MPILASTIHTRALAKLDAEDSDRYLFDKDTKHAINEAQEQLVSMLNQAFGENKLTPEALRELIKVKIWQANAYSRISVESNDLGHSIWSIIAIYPKPQVNTKQPFTSENDLSKSKLIKSASFIGGKFSAKRLTHEEWFNNSDNVFMAGNDTIKGALSEYAYLDFADYTSTSYTEGSNSKHEISIKPSVKNEMVAIAYLKYPKTISSPTDYLEFPESLTNLITDMVLRNIAYKQGDGTSIFAVTSQNINQLVALLR